MKNGGELGGGRRDDPFLLGFGLWFQWLPSRSLTAKAPEKLPGPNRKGLSSNHHFSGAKLTSEGYVSFRKCTSKVSETRQKR